MNSKIKNALALNKRLTLLIPFALIAIFLIILPIILIIVNAFISREGFDSFQLVKETKTWVQIWRSLKIGIVSSIICLIIGLPYAYFVATSKNKFLPIYGISLILSPMIIFTIAKIYAIKGFFLAITPPENQDSLNAEWFMILALVYLNLPYIVMPLYSVFRDMPRNIIEASLDLGYNKLQTFLKVVIPYSLKAIIGGLGLIFLSSATTFVISDKLLLNKNQLQTIGAVINEYTIPSNEFKLASGSVLVLVVSFIFIGSYFVIYTIPRIFIKLKKGWTNE